MEPPAADTLQNNIVLTLPMQDGGQLQRVHLVSVLDGQTSRIKAEHAGQSVEFRERHAAARHLMDGAHVGHVDVVPIGVGDHGHAGKPAFLAFILQNRVNGRLTGKERKFHRRPLMARMGSRTQSMSRRRSTTTSADRVEPTRMGRSMP